VSDRGYEGLAISSGRVALRMLSTERIDALVTDLRMPDVALR
jgi:CheY-like chemotaxis protein